ncbi:hypothetical protein LTR47_005036 [Exophiala xenobiotica]|nr:hypothetical protein LTR41_008317 [Exophiala xenobiotica]KAK5233918.1 hypothetical protein LTR47_005036 [Exophiala xenobiotica]KAK5326698.1 hypothetical protein LTR93_003561 [Exophiala xenobiotica]KAK5351700.1 hypothetical protein LTR61_005050 [Exophiala xenobiotica]KAK5380170.1 hypothetical protein LTR11_003799 [Exophiala xenobiotica]
MRWTLCLLILSFTALKLAYADLPAFSRSKSFDQGDYGNFVAQTYRSTSYSVPRLNVFEKGRSCRDDGLFVMLTLRGWSVPQPAPIIFDGHGGLVWTDPTYVQPYNLQVQTYRGERFLTFWAGDDGVKGHGSGFYYMLDSHYNLRYKLSGGNGLDGDLHEFYLTRNATALITIYQTIQANLTSVSKYPNGWIWDGLFQEIDVETNEVLFEWRASDHLPFTDSQWGPGDLGLSREDAWDWFHINSVEKDERGNYLISSRWLHAIYYIDGISGDILWTLGGKRNDFRDLSFGRATGFASQHHARWHDGYTSITLFDNSSPGPGRPSSGLWLDLDFDKWTVKLRTQYLSRNKISSDSQGSIQTLPSGNVLVGYGMEAQYVEFTRDGDVVCEVHLAPASSFGSASVQSYRTSKHDWVGWPQTDPDIIQITGTIYVSWNGATEVRHWLVEDALTANANDGDFHEVKRVAKNGFETTVSTTGIERPYVRVSALDGSGNVLGRARIVERGEPAQALPETTEEESEEELGLESGQTSNARNEQALVIAAVVLVSALALAGLSYSGFVALQHLTKYYHCKRANGGPILYETIDDLEFQ